MKDIGKNIKTIRCNQNMTQEALAEALFVTRQTVSNYENGRSRPDLDMLLKIAEVLQTDVNTIIYGPPIPQSKKDDYRWLGISAGITLLLGTVYFAARKAFAGSALYLGYGISGNLINKLAVIPLFMMALGWTLIHILSMCSSLQQLQSRRIRVVRVVVLVLLALIMLIPLPYIIWLGVAFYRSYTAHSVSMSFPYIPVYQEVFNGVFRIVAHAPFVYSVLGGLLWVLRLPRVRK